MRRGSKGEDVREFQELLISLGYELPRYGADGDFGGETEAAFKAFRARLRAIADNDEVTDETLAIMKAMAQLTSKPPVTLQIDSTTFRLSPDDYFAEEHKKDLIVLHFTAGTTVSGVYHTFSGSGHVAVSFVVDRDGQIYELFPRRYWAYHLGMRSGNPGHCHDKRSIGIEIVNVGPLKEDPNDPEQLNWWPQNYGVKWCTKSETDRYIQASDRGIDYYATFTKEQYRSVKALIDSLCDEFNIPRRAPADKLMTDVDGLSEFTGIIAHQHYRTDKYDMGPAFDWSEIGL